VVSACVEVASLLDSIAKIVLRNCPDNCPYKSYVGLDMDMLGDVSLFHSALLLAYACILMYHDVQSLVF